MISTPLPAVFFGGRITLGEILEAFATTYWAGYNTEPVESRVGTAFQRAFAVASQTMIPRVGGGMPGGVVANITTPDATRQVVAIEGINGVLPLLNWGDGLNATGVGSLPGYVPKLMKTYAFQFKDFLEARTTTWADMINPRLPLTMAGFSMGASMAEIIGRYIKSIVPTKSVRIIKFGSPRTGNNRWVATRNPAIRFVSVYNLGDPIWAFPHNNYLGWNPVRGWDNVLGNSWYQVDDERKVYTFDGSERRAFIIDNPVQQMGWASDLAVYGPTERAWRFHMVRAYRNTMMAVASTASDELQYRFRWLEFNDENNWQVDWTRNNGGFPPVNAILSPEPIAQEPVTRYEVLRGNYRAEGYRGWDAPDPVNESPRPTTQGTRNTAPVITTQQRPQRRLRSTQQR